MRMRPTRSHQGSMVKMEGAYLRVFERFNKLGPSYSALRAIFTDRIQTVNSWEPRGHTKHRFYSNGRAAVGSSSGSGGSQGMNVFDRKAKRWHKNRASMAPDADTFDYLRDEVRHKQMPKIRILTTITKHFLSHCSYTAN